MTYMDKFKLDRPELISGRSDKELAEHYCVKTLFGPDSIMFCDNRCEKCWNKDCHITQKSKDLKRLDKIGVDVHKLIDEVAEKRDRSLSIWIGKDYITINVYPYPDPADEEEE